MPVHLAAQKMLQLAVLGYPPLWTYLPPMLVDSCVAAQESKHLAPCLFSQARCMRWWRPPTKARTMRQSMAWRGSQRPWR